MHSGAYIDLQAIDLADASGADQFVAVYDDGRAFVAISEATNQNVRLLLAKVERHLKRDLRREYVDLDVIAVRRKEGVAGRRSGADSGMRKQILDLIEKAHALDASDIHFEIEEQVATIYFRIDGILTKHDSWPRDIGRDFLGAAYAMSSIANKTYSNARFLSARLAPRPDDRWAFPARLEAVRCQFNPKAFGESYAVFRLLPTTRSDTTLEALGYEPEQLGALRAFAGRSKGLGIISGPTGSGKSTTLSALLIRQREADAKAHRARTLFTVEDPPERRIPGAQQLVVPNTDSDEQRQFAYAEAIRAALRSDPDVIMIGEIRDRITANLAISASMTGHQVWSTLHCSTAHAIPIRLAELGVDSSVIFGSDELQVSVAQVLAPLLCKECRVPLPEAAPFDGQASLLALLGAAAHVRGPGCKACRNTGIKGRTVVAEVIRTDPAYLHTLRVDGIVTAREFTRSRGEPSIGEGQTR